MEKVKNNDDKSSDVTTGSSMRLSEAATTSSTIVSSDVPSSAVAGREGTSFHDDPGPSSVTEAVDSRLRCEYQDHDSFNASNATRKGDDTRAGDNENSAEALPIRVVVGAGTVQLSDWVNSNLVVARYAAYAGIGIVAAYGLSHSPLFFRFRTVADIPPRHFVSRRKLTCRLVAAASENGGSDGAGSSTAASWGTGAAAALARHGPGPIRFQVRHLSFFERYCLAPSSWFDGWMRLHPSQFRPDYNRNELLTIELAGVVDAASTAVLQDIPHPPPPSIDPVRFDRSAIVDPAITSRCESFVRRFIREGNKPIVTVQLFGRRTFDAPSNDPSKARPGLLDGTTSQSGGGALKKRRIPDHLVNSEIGGGRGVDGGSNDELQVAIAKVTYQSNCWQLFSTDLAHQLVRSGLAVTTSDDGLFPQSLPQLPSAPSAAGVLSSSAAGTTAAAGATTKDATTAMTSTTTPTNPVWRLCRVVDTDRALSTLQRDARYLSWLDQAEHEAAHDRAGAWSDPVFRERRRDVVDEADFQATAPWWKKAWRYVRGA